MPRTKHAKPKLVFRCDPSYYRKRFTQPKTRVMFCEAKDGRRWFTDKRVAVCITDVTLEGWKPIKTLADSKATGSWQAEGKKLVRFAPAPNIDVIMPTLGMGLPLTLVKTGKMEQDTRWKAEYEIVTGKYLSLGTKQTGPSYNAHYTEWLIGSRLRLEAADTLSPLAAWDGEKLIAIVMPLRMD